MIKIYFDENIPVSLVYGIQQLDKPLNKKGDLEVHYLPDILSSGTKDEEWIPVLGSERAVVITQDYNIHRKIAERDLYQQYGLSLIFFSPPSKSGYLYWDLVEQMIRRWQAIRKIVLEEKRPFVFRYTSRKEKAERL